MAERRRDSGRASYHKWMFVGGLMAQLHGIHAGIDAVRPTNDVDVVLHVETTRGVASESARALESLGYDWRRRSTNGTTRLTASSEGSRRLTS